MDGTSENRELVFDKCGIGSLPVPDSDEDRNLDKCVDYLLNNSEKCNATLKLLPKCTIGKRVHHKSLTPIDIENIKILRDLKHKEKYGSSVISKFRHLRKIQVAQ